MLLLLPQGLMCQSLAGTLEDRTFFSQALNEDVTFRVYLPPGYHTAATGTTYPVIYSLHGASVGYEAYSLMYPIVDALWRTGTVRPFILVMPDGKAEPYLGSFYTNSELYGKYEDFIIQDLIPFVDEQYKSNSYRGMRAIMGHSMGSYGAFKLGLKNSGLFIGIAGHSGPLNIEMLEILIPQLKTENGNQAPFNWAPGPGKSLTNLAFSMAGAFSPNLSQTHKVDFPLDAEAEPITAVMDRWKPHNVSRMAGQLPGENPMGIYFDCGSRDDFQLQFQNRAMADSLRKYQIPHQYIEYFGDHNTGLPLRVPVALRFLGALFHEATGMDILLDSPVQYSLYPNPSEGEIRITLSFSQSEEPAKVLVMDLMGRAIMSDSMKSPSHLIDLTGYEPGVYLISVDRRGHRLTKRVILTGQSVRIP